MQPQKKTKHRIYRHFTFIKVTIALVVTGLAIGAMLYGEEIILMSRLRAQVVQLEHFESSVRAFRDKFDGLPGDLLAVTAEREGLPTGDGTPSHSDGDGKISPCNPGWQHHLGCETALFWSHLSLTGFIAGDFNADSRFADDRLDNVTVTMAPYLPVSPMGDGIYVAVWNTDAEQPSIAPALPYGNYFEISRIKAIKDEQIQDSPAALTPLEAYAIDNKIDDGSPLHGHMIVNGNAIWPSDPWGSYAKPAKNTCISLDRKYNTESFVLSHMPLCHLAVRLRCCSKGNKEEAGSESAAKESD